MRLTWLGHSAFRLDLAGKVILIDPFLEGNPAFPGDRAAAIAGTTHIVLTHGHGDHVGDTLAVAEETGATVVTNYDLCVFLASQGLQRFDPMNTGGTTKQDGFSVTLVRADHSASMVAQGVAHAVGSANGVIIKAPGEKTLYHLGDTDIFSDMALIAELHEPKIGIVPIGDRFTMGARTAALAVRRFFKFETVIPSHYASFPMVAGDANEFVAALAGHDSKVLVPRPGTAVDL